MSAHKPWCTAHISEEPEEDVLPGGADECCAVYDVLPARHVWGPVAVTISMMPDGSGPVLTVESYSRLLSVDEAERVYAVLGQALEAVRQ